MEKFMKWLNLGFHFHHTRAFFCRRNWRKLRRTTLRHTFISASFVTKQLPRGLMSHDESIYRLAIHLHSGRDTRSNQASRTTWIREMKKIWIQKKRNRYLEIEIALSRDKVQHLLSSISIWWERSDGKLRWTALISLVWEKNDYVEEIKFARCEFKS